jgi:DNA recombination protein RmuC
MDNNTLMILIAAAVVGIIIGMVVGYLIGLRKSVQSENRATKFETMTNGLNKQIAEKDTEIKRLNDHDLRRQNQLLEAESAKTKAETELGKAVGRIAELIEELEAKDLEITSYRNAHAASEKKNAELDANYKASLKSIEEQKQFLSDANEALKNVFESLSSEALRKNNTSFLDLAKETLEAKVVESAGELEKRKQAIDTLVEPLGKSLENFDKKLGEIEIKREGAYSEMKTLVEAMKGTTDRLETGTRTLVTALKTSHVRGKYGEISLRRVVEAAGLSPYCDFNEQTAVISEDGRLIPDMTVNLPGHRQLILDSKVPLHSYMQAFETEEEDERIDLLKKHALSVRDHLKKLSHKSYWEQFTDAPDFVIMYLQVESSFGAALMTDSALIEDGINNNIVLATPSTLITMLRTVGFMWQQERMVENIHEMRDAGVKLYQRTTSLLEHFASIGSGLGKAIESYNSAVGSLESRFIPQVVKMKEIGGTLMGKDIPEISPIDTAIRSVTKTLSSGDDVD